MVGERWKIGYIIEGKAGKYPKDRALGEGRHEMEVKIGHILKKEKENIQKTGRSEKEDMKWSIPVIQK